jgi:hypothetical protein
MARVIPSIQKQFYPKYFGAMAASEYDRIESEERMEDNTAKCCGYFEYQT